MTRSGNRFKLKWGSRGGGTGGLDPPGKSQVLWVFTGNKQLDPPPPPPGKSWTPPWKMLDSLWNSGTFKNDRFLWNWPFDFCKISWGLKKKKEKTSSELFLSDIPGPPLTKIPGSAHETSLGLISVSLSNVMYCVYKVFVSWCTNIWIKYCLY